MKPTKNRVYCNDCGRVKMLFTTQEKADNFIVFNMNKMILETGIAPSRSYFCSACGGWHVTKNTNNEYFLEKEKMNIRIDEIKKQLKTLVHLFHTQYSKKMPHVWGEKMKILKELTVELEDVVDGIIPEYKMAINCIKQYEHSIDKAIEKEIAKQNLQAITPEFKETFKQFKNAYLTLKTEECIYLANHLKNILDNAVLNGVNRSDIKEKLQNIEDFILPQRIKIIKIIFQLTEDLVNNYKIITIEEINNTISNLQQLIAEANKMGVTHKHLKGVETYIKKIQNDLLEIDCITIKKETKEDRIVINEVRKKVIEAIDLVKAGKLNQAEQVLDIAEGLLIGYENSDDNSDIYKALTYLSEYIIKHKTKLKTR